MLNHLTISSIDIQIKDTIISTNLITDRSKAVICYGSLLPGFTFTLSVFISYFVLFGLLSGHLQDAHSVDHMFSLCFGHLFLVIFRFVFEGWIWVLIASIPNLAYFLLMCMF